MQVSQFFSCPAFTFSRTFYLIKRLTEIVRISFRKKRQNYYGCGEITFQKRASFSIDNGRVSRFSTGFYCVCNHKTFMPKHQEH